MHIDSYNGVPATATAPERLGPPLTAHLPPVVAAPAVAVDVTEAPLRDRVRWGPIIAGVVTAFAVLLFLTVLGIALGVSALGNDDATTWGTAAGIWGGISLLLSFFVGGWMAARSATTIADGDGALNGFIAGAATLLLLLWMATSAVTGALGFFATTVAGVAGTAAPVAITGVAQGGLPSAEDVQSTIDQAADNPDTVVPPEAQQAVDNAEQTAQQAAQTASEAAGPGAWGTAIALFLAIAAATIGGMVGQNRTLLRPGSSVVVRR